ncbi:hypothetical protein C8Q78DRAFT_522652 [Trametes maxima]|nr:hypothetical protein C8Q78DRAFT_522652 [Trametes maxima]
MSYQAPGIYPQKPQPTAPTRRARYQKDDTNWIGIPYKQWDWVVLTRDIGTVFRNGELVCLLDVAPVRISPTERPGQSNQWQRMDFDTQYRIGKYVKETMTRFALCQDKTGSISHMHLSDRSKGSPVKRFLRQGEVVS